LKKKTALKRKIHSRKKDGWYIKRNYLHFDSEISFKKMSNIVKNPDKVSQWSFFPFLKYILKREKISEENGKLCKTSKEREICYACHTDSHIYSYYSKMLTPYYEKFISQNNINNITAFRKISNDKQNNKCNIDFAFDVFNEIKSLSPCIAISFDIKDFFNNIDHKILKDHLCKIIEVDTLPKDYFAVFKSLTKFSFVNKNEIYTRFNITKSVEKKINRICTSKEFRDIVRKEKLIHINTKTYGIPQGSPISGLLSNIYLSSFDKNIHDISTILNAKYYRYCDDIIIICQERDKLFFENYVSMLLFNLKVSINTRKTVTTIFRKNANVIYANKPVQYLGFMFDGENIFIRSATYTKFLSRMKKGVELARQTAKKYNKIRILKGNNVKNIYKHKIYDRYSHLGKRNFISYALRASKKMQSKSIRQQIKPLWKKLQDQIEKANQKIY